MHIVALLFEEKQFSSTPLLAFSLLAVRVACALAPKAHKEQQAAGRAEVPLCINDAIAFLCLFFEKAPKSSATMCTEGARQRSIED